MKIPNAFKRFFEGYDKQCKMEVPSEPFESKLHKIKCSLRAGMKVGWYYKDDLEFQQKHDPDGDLTRYPPYSGYIIPDIDVESVNEFEWDEVILVVTDYPTEKCNSETDWVVLGMLIENEDLVEIFEIEEV